MRISADKLTVQEWLDSSEGQMWLNDTHRQINWSHGAFGDCKIISANPRLIYSKAAATMTASQPMSPEEEEEFLRTGRWRTDSGVYVDLPC